MADRNARWGLWLFAIYTFCYALFVGVNTLSPELMEQTPVAGVNLAVLSGFGLIILAFVLAMIYGFVARDDHGTAHGTTHGSAQSSEGGQS